MMQTDSGMHPAVPRMAPRPLHVVAPVRGAASVPAEPPVSAADLSSYEALLLEHLDFLDRTVAAVARRNAVPPWDAEDLAGQVRLRLVANDYAVLRRFEGRSRLTTYLTTVVHNIFRDFRIQRWGKWRPSAAAQRLGDLGVQLEALLYRDRFGAREAFTILRDRFDVTATDQELEAMAGRLRPRTTRRIETDTALARLASTERGDRSLRDSESSKLVKRVADALRSVLAALEPEDRLILRMRFAEGLTIRAIASALDLEQRRMYTRVQRLLVEVRRRLEAEGVECEAVLDLLDDPGADLDAGLTESGPDD